MLLTLVITTHDRPDALAAVLTTVARQSDAADEVIVADDGSGSATAELVARFGQSARYPVRHVRQEHAGYRLARLRNLAIAHAHGEYVVFIDGDMLLHPAFIADHRRHARPGSWVQGVRVRLDAAATQRALEARDHLPSLASSGLGRLRRLYLLRSPRLARIVRRAANGVVAVKGCNQAFWRADLLSVNGYDEAIEGWGPEDKELCARLAHCGIRRATLLFGGVAFHLHHRAASREWRAVNDAVLARTRALRLVRCVKGLDGHHPSAFRPPSEEKNAVRSAAVRPEG